jgi:hypothetical protein
MSWPNAIPKLASQKPTSNLQNVFADDPELLDLAAQFEQDYPQWARLVQTVSIKERASYRAGAEAGDPVASLRLLLSCAVPDYANRPAPKTVALVEGMLRGGFNFGHAFKALEKDTYRDWEGDLENTHHGKMLVWVRATAAKFRSLVNLMPDHPVVIMPRVPPREYSEGKTLQFNVNLLRSGRHKEYLLTALRGISNYLDRAEVEIKKIQRSATPNPWFWKTFEANFDFAVSSLEMLADKIISMAPLYEGGGKLLQEAQELKNTGIAREKWKKLPVPKVGSQKLKPVSWSIGGSPPPPAWTDGLEDVRLTYPQALELWRTDLPYFWRDGVADLKKQEKEAELDSRRALANAERYDQTRQDGAGRAEPLAEGAQLLREASKLHFQASAELEEAWMKLEAALGHEEELRATFKRMRQTPRDIEKVFGRTSKSYDNPDFLLAAKAYRRVLDWFLTLDQEYKTARGAADKLTKQARALEERAAVLFAVSQGRLRAFDT